MVRFIWQPISNTTQIGRRRNKSAIKYICIHGTGNPSKGANAMAHFRYLQHATRYGSAQIYVDDSTIIQVIGDSYEAWAIGDNQGYGRALNGATNYNSINIEMCVNSDGDFNKTLFNTIELVKNLLALFPHAIVCRHWDVSRKDCPHGFTGNNNAKWNSFLEEIKKPRRMLIDLSKTSECKLVGNNNMPNQVEKKFKGYFVLTNTPNDVLNVREKPDYRSRLVSSYRDKSKIYVHEIIKTSDSTWYKIEYHKGTFGYVNARYCKGIN